MDANKRGLLLAFKKTHFLPSNDALLSSSSLVASFPTPFCHAPRSPPLTRRTTAALLKVL
jgi:hypothetical protein